MPCFETPARAEYVKAQLSARGHALHAPQTDSRAVLSRVHAPRYLAFLENAWRDWCALEPGNAQRQPFPSVWPVRSLRSDVEPENFIARLGLYSMDNGSPLSADAWLAAGCSAARWFEALEQACRRIGACRCEALVVSLGLDTFAEDPISTFALQASDFSRLGERLGALGLPTVFVLAGGYAAAALGRNAVNVIEGFEGA